MCMFISYRAHQNISRIVQWLKGTSSGVLLQEFPHLKKQYWGRRARFSQQCRSLRAARATALDAADEYYHADLIGLAVVDTAGAAIGRVVAIQNFGAGDLVEVAPAAGGETVLLPFTEAVVPRIDIAAGRIVAHALEELLQAPPPVGEDREAASPPLDRGRACPT